MDSREGAAASPEADAEKASRSSSSDSDEEGGASGQTEMELLQNLFSRTLGFGSEKPEKVLEELTLEGVTNFILTEKCKNIVCVVGAGISTSAGIPDFRSPGTGLYANLQQFNLPYPEAIFEIDYFKQNPEPFFTLAREIYPGHVKPTICHYFIRLLKDKGLLLRCYTQNVDALERVAGLDPEHLVEVHGTFYTFHCISSTCKKPYSLEWMIEKVFTSLIPRCEKCQNIVKPDIVFFGEFLPPHFFSLMQSDSQNVDLLIIMGTSLQVEPFSSLVSSVPANTPRLLINKEKTGESDPSMSLMGLGCGMDFDSEKAYRDVAWLGDCDEGCLALAELLGWKEELEELVKNEHAVIEAKSGQIVGVGAGADRQPAKKQEQNPSLEKEKPPANKEE
ncbi:NAD-dependent protein deacetylase sirtuin-2-like isoform X1 [Crotalus tigris]|uniref:NAD-dependent protein deacetylase sirtuin-2-like isoform X1 n=1 Tax=Crotalus tigris TaxID=88082 RepID=UPI00192F837A|nr:NAD-dependent protein deacetylase sirtuin-2-like isoform X1 [Crotalus tigris]XP_039181044.1 NAD-dependent protein deacetylase sirtuin-2-like isoform X1 [Crotalus tigris]XP_039181046.1 NAD-dependent protein deacetylase sirtuin-2-like isoform X1 [Crotalus tigris]XP_039181047.1 NAD-dependent protein deacetylase sirtuin-2-like isoform X1 [Crotalus tigris]